MSIISYGRAEWLRRILAHRILQLGGELKMLAPGLQERDIVKFMLNCKLSSNHALKLPLSM